MADLEKIVEELSQLSVLEASELVKLLEEKWGVFRRCTCCSCCCRSGCCRTCRRRGREDRV